MKCCNFDRSCRALLAANGWAWSARQFLLLLRQAPDFFDFAKSCKHLFIFLVGGCSFRYPDKLDEVSVGTVKYDKGIRAGLPAPMLAEVMQLFGSRACPTYVFIGYIRGIVHYVRNVGSSHVVICIRI